MASARRFTSAQLRQAAKEAGGTPAQQRRFAEYELASYRDSDARARGYKSAAERRSLTRTRSFREYRRLVDFDTMTKAQERTLVRQYKKSHLRRRSRAGERQAREWAKLIGAVDQDISDQEWVDYVAGAA